MRRDQGKYEVSPPSVFMSGHSYLSHEDLPDLKKTIFSLFPDIGWLDQDIELFCNEIFYVEPRS